MHMTHTIASMARKHGTDLATVASIVDRLPPGCWDSAAETVDQTGAEIVANALATEAAELPSASADEIGTALKVVRELTDKLALAISVHEPVVHAAYLARDFAIRAANRLGARPQDIYAAAGISRERYYQIIGKS